MTEEQLLFYALTSIRRSLPMDAWPKFADAIVQDRKMRQKHLENPEPDRSWFGILDEMKARGFARLPSILTPEKLGEIRSYFEANAVHKGPHVYSFDGMPKHIEKAKQEFSMVGYRFDQVAHAPHLVDTFNDPRLVDMIEGYLGCVPTLYSINAWWSFPASEPQLIHSQHFHRDIDDWRFVTLFLYLTDVDAGSGPHQIVEGSRSAEGLTALIEKARKAGKNVDGFNVRDSFVETAGGKLSSDCEHLFESAIVNATGPAGTMWLVDTTNLHRGLLPTRSPRLVVWARYGLGPCVNSADIEQGPIARRLIPTALADTPRNRFVNRLLFDFDRGPAHF